MVLQILADGTTGARGNVSAETSAMLQLSASPQLRNVMQKIPQDQRYTAWYDRDRDDVDGGVANGEASAIDHVLVSPRLWQLMSEVRIDHGVPASKGLSDHWPLLVTFGQAETPHASSDSHTLQGNCALDACGLCATIFVFCALLSVTMAS